MRADRHRRTLAAGEILFREGDQGHEAYVVESGCIEIYTGDAASRRRVARLGRDELFGEMTLVGSQTRVASALALETTTVTVVSHDYLEERLESADPLLRHLLRVAIIRGRDSMQRLGELNGAASAPAPVADPDGSADQRAALQRLRLEQAMETALERQEFRLYLQPIVHLHDGSPAGFETLIRWIRADGSQVSPGEFIPVAEQSEFINILGHWIIRDACRLMAALDQAAPGREPFLSLNLSFRQFRDPELFPVLEAAMREHRVVPQRLRLEITESMIAHDMQAAKELLGRCKALGAKLSVDDFGTGYSSLSYLQHFPMDSLKLDRSFIGEIGSSPAAAKIVGAVARLAADLGMQTVAEGIETAEQAARCRELGIDYGQGFHWARALPEADAIGYLRRGGVA
ncbi:MAG TPA: EAL domain-containing protein [Solimonas sp.]|nr:EAL domain-containing protein [Solimonas sp.]